MIFNDILGFFKLIDGFIFSLIGNYGDWIYLIGFLVIMVEAVIIFAPFLPGSSLLISLGAVAGAGDLNIVLLIIIMSVGTFIGDIVNYFIGKKLLFVSIRKNWISEERVLKINSLYKKHGGIIVTITKALPFTRNVSAFAAGASRMKFPRFLIYNLIGVLIQVGVFLLIGYFWGNLNFVKENFTLMVLLIVIVLVIIPIIIGAGKEIIKYYRRQKTKARI